MNTSRICKRRKNIKGDDLDDHYLNGEIDYNAIMISVVIAIFIVVAFWPKKG